jgi:Putative beta-barrel porin-2, OmpL-like. bbp2
MNLKWFRCNFVVLIVMMLSTISPFAWGNESDPASTKESLNGDHEEEKKSPPNSSKEHEPNPKEPPRRALPAPFASPPFPSGEFQGSPLVGVPPSDEVYPLMELIYKSQKGDAIKKSRIKAYGWINASANVSTSRRTNLPDAYWFVPNHIEMDQAVFRLERELDSVQTSHVDIGFRSTILYGTDYRFITAGGWTSNQLLRRNQLYGYDFTEQYIDLYIPWIAQGMIIRTGRWISCPDIETQFAPDNYMGSHSLLYTYDTSTQTGVMLTAMINKYWTVQAAIHAGTDMAPWYKGAVPTGMFAVRWVARDNKDSIYLVLNSINSAKFRHFRVAGRRAGHDNFNCLAGTWQHAFTDKFIAKTEGYFMWQRDAVVGGTPIIGPSRPYASAGKIGSDIPGTTWTYGVVNYTMYAFSKKGFVTLRNEIWRDADGERSGFRGTYTSHAIGMTYNYTPIFQIRPEIGYYRNWDHRAFDKGKRRGIVLFGADMTLRF